MRTRSSRLALGLVQHLSGQQTARQSVPQSLASPNLYHGLLPLVFMDTCNCIVQRKIPVFRLRPRSTQDIDRYIGLLSSLIPIYSTYAA